MSQLSVGNKLKALIDGAGISQNSLSKKIGVSRAQVGKWVRDINRPGPDHIRALAAVLEVSPAYLAGHEETPATDPAQLLTALTKAKAARDELDAAIRALESAQKSPKVVPIRPEEVSLYAAAGHEDTERRGASLVADLLNEEEKYGSDLDSRSKTGSEDTD